MPEFTFDATLYLWRARTESWVFVSLPEEIADEIEDVAPQPRRGFGSVRVEVTVGATTWRTSIFPSKEDATFVLPVKKPVQKAEGIGPGDTATVLLRVLDA